jgi:hypothetical protein
VAARIPGPEVLDLAHLARYTIGNRELERNCCGCSGPSCGPRSPIAQARDAQDWRFATHTLKGVARSIGAWAIADTAEKLEQLGHAGDDRGVYGRLMVAWKPRSRPASARSRASSGAEASAQRGSSRRADPPPSCFPPREPLSNGQISALRPGDALERII